MDQGNGPSAEEFHAMVNAMLADPRIGLAGQDYKRGQGDYAVQQPGGTNLGYTYVASNPMEHLAAAIQRAQGGMRMDQAQAAQQGLLGQKGAGVGTFWDLYRRSQPVGPQTQQPMMPDEIPGG